MTSFKDIKKTYVFAPAGYTSGGPELLHQLVYTLNKLGVDASIVYYGAASYTPPPPPSYARYIKDSVPYTEIEDTSENMVIVPETAIAFLPNFNHMQKVIWWLSVDNFYYYNRDKSLETLRFLLRKRGIKCALKRLFKKRPCLLSFASPIIQNAFAHLCQCEYAMDWCRQYGLEPLYLSDYVADDYLNVVVNRERKEDIIAYNPKKGAKFTQRIVHSCPDLRFIPIVNMTREEVLALLSRAKVYIDFGDHPGKDRIPREARLAGCVVITGIDGSAGFSKDVPIAHKVPAKRGNINKIARLIRTVLANYDEYDKQQQAYTESIKREKDDFVQQVKNLWIL